MRFTPQRPFLLLAVLLAAAAGLYLVSDPLLALLLGAIFGSAAATTLLLRPRPLPEAPPEPRPPPPERARTADILDALPEPTLLIDEGRIAGANRPARELLGQWIEGADVRLALRHPQTVGLLLGEPPAPGRVEQVEIAGLGDADRRWLMAVSTIGKGCRLVRLIDRSEAAAAERMRVDFVANASHELRTPLATVLGFLETLQDPDAGGDEGLRSRFLGLMHGEAKRMQQLIEDLMSLSRIEAERFNVPREPVDLVPLVEEVRLGCDHLLAERNNRLVLDDGSRSAVVAGDRGQLLQLVRNLVVNAIKYGSPDSEVTVRIADEDSRTVQLVVQDRGIGIAPEHLPRLTERFYRVDPGRSRSVGGTGLGLAIVKHIVGRHRGRLDIRSEPGRGTAVAVSLPLADDLS